MNNYTEKAKKPQENDESIRLSTQEIEDTNQITHEPLHLNTMVSMGDDVQPTRCTVALKMGGQFKMEAFAYYTFIRGLALQVENNVEIKKSAIMLAKIAELGMVLQPDATLYLKNDEVRQLYAAVQARMEHCELEKDTDRFNKSTYISMKYLLLDLKLWLMGEIIEHE